MADFNDKEFSKNEVLKYLDYLSSIQFLTTSSVLELETVTIQNILIKRFNEPMSGRKLYEEIRRHFSKVTDAVMQTPSGRKLLEKQNQAISAQNWSPHLFIEVARQIENLGLPFHEEFLTAHSSLVGMMLAELYGYPIPGVVLLRRIHRAGQTVANLRTEAGLPAESVHNAKINRIENLEWSRELVIEILRTLKEHGFEVLEKELTQERLKISELLWRVLGIKISPISLDDHVAKYGGWVALKKEIGFSYNGVKKHYAGHLDWTPELMIEIFKTSNELGYELHHKFLRNKVAFAPLKKVLEEKFGGYISGRLLYERSSAMFGSFEEACRQADVPYTEHNMTQVPTLWNAWSDKTAEYDINQLQLIEIFSFINANGQLPTREFLQDIVAFEPMRIKIQDIFGVNVSGDTLYKLSLDFFDSHQASLEAVGIYRAPKDIAAAQVRESIGYIFFAFGELSNTELKSQFSDKIAELLKEKMGLAITGEALLKAISQLPPSETYRSRLKSIFYEFKSTERNQIQQESESDKTRALERLKNKDFFAEVIHTLTSSGVLFNKSIARKVQSRQVRQVLIEKYGINVSGAELVAIAKNIFGGLKEARIAAGLPGKMQQAYRKNRSTLLQPTIDLSVMDVTELEIKIFVEAIFKKWPDTAFSNWKQLEISQAIKHLLSEKYSVTITGSTIVDRIKEKYGSLKEATTQLDIKIPWGKSREPSKEELTAVLKHIHTKGFNITPRFLRDYEADHPELMQSLEEEFGFKIRGISVYNFSRIVFGGLENAVKEAGLDYKPLTRSEVQPSTRVVLSEDQLRTYLTAIFTTYPDTTFKEFSESATSLKIKKFLKQKFNVEYSGSLIYRRIVEDYGSLRAAAETLQLKLAWNRNNPPTKEQLLQVLKFIGQRGYNITPKFLREFEYNNQKLMDEIKAEFGFEIRGVSIYAYARDLFGQVETAVEAAGLKYNLPTSAERAAETMLNLTDGQIKIFIEALVREFPNMAFHHYQRARENKQIQVFLKEKFAIDCSGSILIRRIWARFGSVENAAKKLDIKIPWGFSYTPSKEEIISVLQFIHGKGYKITTAFLKSFESTHPELMDAIQLRFGRRIRGISIYRYSFDFYEKDGFNQILREAGIRK